MPSLTRVIYLPNPRRGWLRSAALGSRQPYRGGRSCALVVIAVAGFSEHDPEQGRSLQRELHVGDRYARYRAWLEARA
jgi:hypothetical protein